MQREAMRKVLVVDDNLPLAENIAEILELDGIEAVPCASGDEALAIANSDCPCALVTDMRMPGMTGLDVAKRFRSCCPSLPVLLITAYAQDVLQQSGGSEICVLQKPFSPVDLLTTVHDLLEPLS